MRIALIALPLLLTGCMTTPVQPVRPVLACDDCRGLTYYGSQHAPQEAPGVALARTLAGAAVQIANAGFMADAIKSTSKTIADAGKYAIVEQPAPTVITQPDPTIVTQPDPMIINQPPPIIVPQPPPIIVEPVVIQGT